MQHNCHTYHTYNSKHTCHTYHTYHTSILSKHAIPDRPYTPYIPNIPYHTPTTPQGGRGTVPHPHHTTGGEEEDLNMGPIPCGGGEGGGGRAWCIYVVRVVQILALGGWREHIFLHICRFWMTKGLGSQPSRLALQCDMLQALLPQGKRIPACSACRLWARHTFLCGDQCGEFSISLPKASCQNTATDIQKRNAVHTSFHRARDLSRGKCPATHLKKEQSLATHTGPDTDPCRPRSRIGLHWWALTRLPTWTHAEVRKPKSHTHRALPQTHADPRKDRFLHGRRHWRGPTRTHAGTPPRTDADTYADPRGDPSPHWRGHPRGPTSPRTAADTDSKITWRVAPFWGRRCGRPASVSASVSASVRGPGPLVGLRGCPRGQAVGARVGPRGSAWVRISVRVSAGRKNRGADLTHTHTHFATTWWQEHRTRIWHRHLPGTLHSNRATGYSVNAFKVIATYT